LTICECVVKGVAPEGIGQAARALRVRAAFGGGSVAPAVAFRLVEAEGRQRLGEAIGGEEPIQRDMEGHHQARAAPQQPAPSRLGNGPAESRKGGGLMEGRFDQRPTPGQPVGLVHQGRDVGRPGASGRLALRLAESGRAE
jgi:hypothetical protein